MIIAGLTGNYGMGKSTVAKMFGELGAVTIDTDILVAGLLNDPEVMNEVKETFGEKVIQDNAINKTVLADMVFESPSLRVALENILHPLVFKKIDEQLAGLARTDSQAVVIIEVPLVYERGYQNRFDRIITVYTTEETAIRHLREKGISEANALKRLKSQFPIDMKISLADYHIDNSGELDATRRQVAFIYDELTVLAKSGGASGTLYRNNYGNN